MRLGLQIVTCFSSLMIAQTCIFSSVLTNSNVNDSCQKKISRCATNFAHRLVKRLYLVILSNSFFSCGIKDMELAHIKDHIRLIPDA